MSRHKSTGGSRLEMRSTVKDCKRDLSIGNVWSNILANSKVSLSAIVYEIFATGLCAWCWPWPLENATVECRYANRNRYMNFYVYSVTINEIFPIQMCVTSTWSLGWSSRSNVNMPNAYTYQVFFATAMPNSLSFKCAYVHTYVYSRSVCVLVCVRRVCASECVC